MFDFYPKSIKIYDNNKSNAIMTSAFFTIEGNMLYLSITIAGGIYFLDYGFLTSELTQNNFEWYSGSNILRIDFLNGQAQTSISENNEFTQLNQDGGIYYYIAY